ncbi:MAG: ArsR family transcriptional regulator, partial [Clostridiaceae bacterium]|nr:ArsR family transcriptional regulator [Clostridiaceae bacterium]
MKKIRLTSKKELNIYMSPVRQQLLRQLSISHGPMTPKMLSDKLQISPSSVQHHIRKLRELEVVDLDHTKVINGIKASYYKAAQVTVQIGLDASDELDPQREVLMENIISEAYKGFRRQRKKRSVTIGAGALDDPVEWGDIKSGVVHLPDEKAKELLRFIAEFIDEYSSPQPT